MHQRYLQQLDIVIMPERSEGPHVEFCECPYHVGIQPQSGDIGVENVIRQEKKK
jgi:hypothetical protein